MIEFFLLFASLIWIVLRNFSQQEWISTTFSDAQQTLLNFFIYLISWQMSMSNLNKFRNLFHSLCVSLFVWRKEEICISLLKILILNLYNYKIQNTDHTLLKTKIPCCEEIKTCSWLRISNYGLIFWLSFLLTSYMA